MDISDIKTMIEAQGETFAAFKAKQDERFEQLEGANRELALKAGRAPLFSAGTLPKNKTTDTFVDQKTRQELKAYAGTDPITDPASVKSDTPSLGRVIRGLVLGARATDHKQLAEERKALGIGSDPSGGYTVDGSVASEWVDNLRASMVLTRAGCQTMPMDTGSVTFVRLTGDPTVGWHGENSSDIPEAGPTFGAATLTARTVACAIRMSVELAQDGVNIDKMIEAAITAAMATAVDAAGLTGVTTNAGAAPMTGAGIFGMPDRNTVTSVGAPTSWDFVVDGMYELMADNVPQELIGATIGHPALWRKMRKLKTGLSGDNTPLTMPAEVAALPKLWTTAAPTDKAVVANWRDLVMGVRRELTIVPHSAYMGTHLQVGLVAYMRCDFVSLRSASFCTMEGITVA